MLSRACHRSATPRGRRVRSPRRIVTTLGLFLCVLAGSASVADGRDRPWARGWVATWASAPSPLFPGTPGVAGFENRTVRNVVHVSVGGRAVRLRLTNRFGTRPVKFDAVRVGIQQDGATVAPGSNRVVTFRGRTRVTIPDGAEILSDPIPLRVVAEQNVAVSLYSAGPTGPPTGHWLAKQRNYLSSAGDFTADTSAAAFTTPSESWYFLTAVDVLASPRVRGAIVALGDSITDGWNTTLDANRRWPDVLARRLLAGPAGRLRAVVNAGITGNNVHESSPCFGENAVARLNDDVFARAGVSEVIVFEGINDLWQPEVDEPQPGCSTRIPISADGMIEHYEQIIDRAHARGLSVYGGTLTPAIGWPGGFSEAAELKRQQINHWIRTSGAFDAVIDFDAAIRDPQQPSRLAPQYDSGDHLHPNDTGQEALGDAAYRKLRRIATSRWRD